MTLALLSELVETASVLQIVGVTHRAAGGSRMLALSGTFSTLTAAFDILVASTGITGVTHRATGGTRLLALSAAADFDRSADFSRRAAGGTCLLALSGTFALAAHFDILKTGSAGILVSSARASLELLLTAGLGASTAGSNFRAVFKHEDSLALGTATGLTLTSIGFRAVATEKDSLALRTASRISIAPSAAGGIFIFTLRTVPRGSVAGAVIGFRAIPTAFALALGSTSSRASVASSPGQS